MLGVIIGVTSVILLVSIGTGLKSYVTGQLEDMGANTVFVMPGQIGVGDSQSGFNGAGIAASKLTLDHVKNISRRAHTIKSVMGYTENNATMKYQNQTHTTQVAGVGVEYPQIRSHQVKKGSFFSLSHYNAGKRVALLGNTTAQELFNQQNPVNKRLTISGQHYLVLGVLEEKGAIGGIDQDDQVFIPLTTATRQFDMKNIHSIMIQSQSRDLASQTIREVEQILAQDLKDDEFSILDTKDLLNTISNILGVFTIALAGIASISLLVGGIGIMNIMLVSVTERTKEIGLRKAVGATPKAVLFQFLVEAIILSFFGGLIGIGLGFLGSVLASRFISTQVTLGTVFLAFGVSTLVGIVFGVAPAYKASKLDPIEALRYEW